MYRYYQDYDSVLILVIKFMFYPIVSLTSVGNWVTPGVLRVVTKMRSITCLDQFSFVSEKIGNF